MQVRRALLWDVFTPPAPEAPFCLSPVHLGVLQSPHQQEPPKTLPSPLQGGKTPRGRSRESGVTLVTGGRCVTSQGLIGAPVRAGTSVTAAVGAEERQAR